MKLLTTFAFLFLCLSFGPLMTVAILSRKEALRELRLSTTPNFTEKQLKNAYRKRSLETHPDKGGSSDQFVRVAEAYEILSGTSDNSNFGSSGGSARGGPTTSDEERMHQAEEMFFEMFEDLFDKQTGDLLVDKLFQGVEKETWSVKLVKSGLKWALGKVSLTLSLPSFWTLQWLCCTDVLPLLFLVLLNFLSA